MSQEPSNSNRIESAPETKQKSYPKESMYYMNDSQSSSSNVLPETSTRKKTSKSPSMEYRHRNRDDYASSYYSQNDHYLHDDEDPRSQQMHATGSTDNRRNMPFVDEVDARSVFVGNVDYGTTPPELQEHFKNCGPINRITIMVDRHTGHPKGYAYIEFMDESASQQAIALNDSTFRDRSLKVVPKRKNMPGFHKDRHPYGRGYSGNSYSSMMRGNRMRGRARGSFGYMPRHRGRGSRAVHPY